MHGVAAEFWSDFHEGARSVMVDRHLRQLLWRVRNGTVMWCSAVALLPHFLTCSDVLRRETNGPPLNPTGKISSEWQWMARATERSARSEAAKQCRKKRGTKRRREKKRKGQTSEV